MDDTIAQQIVEKTIADYNRISALWSTKRSFLPTDMKEMACLIDKNDKILDLGCGNGIFYEAVQSPRTQYTGLDSSEKLIEIARSRYPDGYFVVTEPFDELPFLSNSFDKIFCLSVIHHIPSQKLRLKFLSSIKNVLADHGKLILTSWNATTKMSEWWRENMKKYDISGLDQNDIYFPMKNSAGEIEMERYIHCFSETELSDLLQSAGFEIEEIKIMPRNTGKFSNIFTLSTKKND